MQALRQLHAIGQAGEGIEVRQALQLLLLFALARDVQAHPQHARGLALGVVADDLAHVTDPARAALRQSHAPGHVKRGGRRARMALHLGLHTLDVFRCQASAPAVRSAGLPAGHGAPACVAADKAHVQIPVPQAQGRSGYGE